MSELIILICLFFILWALGWKRYYSNGRTPFISSWDWWRNNHFLSIKDAAIMVIRADIYRPLNNTYRGLRLKLRWLWGKIPTTKRYKLTKRIEELRGKMSNKFPDVLYVAKNTGTEWLRLMSEKRNDTDVKYVRSSEAHWRAEERKKAEIVKALQEWAAEEIRMGNLVVSEALYRYVDRIDKEV